MSDLCAVGELVHSGGETVELHSGRTSDWIVRAGFMEKIMRKSRTQADEPKQAGELTEAELDAVNGGANWLNSLASALGKAEAAQAQNVKNLVQK